MTFNEIVYQVIDEKIQKKTLKLENRTCPDQFVGLISTFNTQQKDFNRLPVAGRPSNTPCLIMILESPHKKEFSKPLGPAKGSTGRKIREHILTVNSLSTYSTYGLILVNAIQNQCSLGIPTKCFRDDVFRATWNDQGKNDFIKRLKDVYQSGDAIINCCTKGNGSPELRQMVHDAIMTANLGCPLIRRTHLRRTHPESWHNKDHRISEWSYL